MPEERIFIKNDSLIIEGLLHKSSGERGVIICHPHPLMGGSMYNNVVEAIQEAFAAENFSTLRFNFRGVGGSTGIYDEGRGEVGDILSAREYLINKWIVKIYFLPVIPLAPGSGQKSLNEIIIFLRTVCLFRRLIIILILIGQN